MDFYDYIVIDTPPALNLLTVNAYAVSDYLIIPMASDILSLVGLSQLKETVESVRIQINPGLKIMGILLNRFNPRTCLCRDVLEMAGQLAAQLETRVFDTKIRSGWLLQKHRPMEKVFLSTVRESISCKGLCKVFR